MGQDAVQVPCPQCGSASDVLWEITAYGTAVTAEPVAAAGPQWEPDHDSRDEAEDRVREEP